MDKYRETIMFRWRKWSLHQWLPRDLRYESPCPARTGDRWSARWSAAETRLMPATRFFIRNQQIHNHIWNPAKFSAASPRRIRHSSSRIPTSSFQCNWASIYFNGPWWPLQTLSPSISYGTDVFLLTWFCPEYFHPLVEMKLPLLTFLNEANSAANRQNHRKHHY